MPRGFGSARTVGPTRWHHYHPSAALVVGPIFLMFVIFGVLFALALMPR